MDINARMGNLKTIKTALKVKGYVMLCVLLRHILLTVPAKEYSTFYPVSRLGKNWFIITCVTLALINIIGGKYLNDIFAMAFERNRDGVFLDGHFDCIYCFGVYDIDEIKNDLCWFPKFYRSSYYPFYLKMDLEYIF